jgi:UDP-N-acetylglucosamine acyltransferase
MLANHALLGGHCVLDDNVLMSGHSALHQFVHLGRLSLMSGLSGTTKDVPPFIIQQRINCVVGVNVVGMRRAGIPSDHIDAVRRAFQLIYHSGLGLIEALVRVEQEVGQVSEVAEMVAFIRQSQRGIILHTDRAAA